VSACRTRSRHPCSLVTCSRHVMVLQADTQHLLCRPTCGKALCPLFEFQEPSITALTSRFGARDLFPGPFETGCLKRRPHGCARAAQAMKGGRLCQRQKSTAGMPLSACPGNRSLASDRRPAATTGNLWTTLLEFKFRSWSTLANQQGECFRR